ncbi:hydroxymethylglutaryl-CoA lyase [Cryomorphaceae bacterium 1068]|nr:hydroxymethylglutaryl-CoA lyase [Cryomorphaceae bacterium 1068]
MLELIECPRDAMQGIKEFIPTHKKIEYINLLIEAGFHTIDFGSFVSPKAIPQMADTAEVLKGLKLNDKTKLLAIIANKRGAQDASQFDEITYLGYPFSVSEEFQKRNTNATLEESVARVGEIKAIADRANKEMVVYLSMAFGNPYGEEWNPDNVIRWAERLHREFGIEILALSDTIGTSSRGSIDRLFNALIPELPDVNFGAHLHTTPETWREKVDAAYQAGCRRFDGALKGYGGCPMAKDDLTGNMPMEKMLSYFDEREVTTGVNQAKVDQALLAAADVFPL